MPNLLNPVVTQSLLPTPTINNSLLVGNTDGSLSWIDQNTLINKPIKNVIYVTKNGSDSNSGKSLSFPKSSIKSAINAATEGTTIVISSGVYIEQTPLVCPPNVAIVAQDSLVQIKSVVDSADVFYLNSGTVIDGLTVINNRIPSFAFSIKPDAVILKAPVIRNCSVITGPFLNDHTLFIPNQTVQIEGVTPTKLPIIDDLVPIEKQVDVIGSGNGILVDGGSFSNNSIEKLVIVDSCNIFSQGGIGILVKNSSNCQASLCSVKFCDVAYKTETGGKLFLNSCTSSYGNYALYANGFDDVNLITGTIDSFTVDPDTLVINQIILKNLIKQPLAGTVISIDNTDYRITSATLLNSGTSNISIISNLTTVELDTEVEIYNDSRIIADNHYFDYVGSGVTYNALPENNGQVDNSKQVLEYNFGSVYYSSNDLSGLYKIGNIFEVNQITGAITTTPTTESLINLGAIGPLIRNGVPVGVAMKEISNNEDLIASTNQVDSYTVPTQNAVYNYLINNYLPLTGGIVTGSTSIQDIIINNNSISSNDSNQNIVISPNGTGSVDVANSKIVNLLTPVDDNDAATRKFVVDLVQSGVTIPSIIPQIWGSNQPGESLRLNSTQSATKPTAGVILNDGIESTSLTTGTLVVTGGVGISGNLNAKTKSFNIKHPLDSSKRLCYGSLESPYHGIRLTGKNVVINGECMVVLPNYISKLVKEEDSQVQLTNIKHNKVLWVDCIDIKNNQFVVKTDEKQNEYQFYWSFTAIRKDVDDLIVEYTQL